MDVKVFDSSNEVVSNLAEELLKYSLANEPVNISLSGGTTPKQLFRFIAEGEMAKKICWRNLHFWWGDERCVPSDSPESNYGEAVALLFQFVEIPMENLHRIRGEADPEIEKERYRKEMKRYLPAKLGRPQFDWVLLGVGDDGHTASLFPNKTDYATEEGVVIAEHPDSGQLRLSLAAPVIRVAKRLSYLVLGESKAQVVKQILERLDGYQDYPAANISTTEGKTEWYLDKDSASALDA